MKNNIAIRRQTYGSALNDCTNVHSRIRIVYPWRSNLIKRAARNSRKKPTLNVLACKIQDGMRWQQIDDKTNKISFNTWMDASSLMENIIN